MTQSVVLKLTPGRHLHPDDFELRNTAPPGSLLEGEVRLRVRWLSIDPYQRGLLDQTPMFGRRVMVGDVMAGRGIGEVIESRSERFSPGQLVIGETGWSTEAVTQEHALIPLGGSAERLSPESICHYLGVLGVPGLTAFLGLETMGGVDADDVILVSSAAGAVGGTVVQLAKVRGAKVIGITSGALKTSFLKENLKVDFVIDRLQGTPLSQQLLEAAPDGISGFFDNVGEQTLVDGLSAMRPRGRVLLCGYLSGYEAAAPVAPSEALRVIMRQRIELRGFLVHDHAALFGEARSSLARLLHAGQLQAVQTVTEGLGSAPAALCNLLAGRSIGKVMVRVSEND
ncbi:MDR family NADP-dependent oxidoreductase [Ottowia caeni]|uniref:MDR family NADP-dependent oxidoreductase n=1 Tax=Ottowia caeni TaxID=2870339 RepID=UPI001E2E42B3|nr:NADP-dependent oxidoreductase [Ottowia caeni]